MAEAPQQVDEVDIAQLRMANNYSAELDVGGEGSPYGASSKIHLYFPIIIKLQLLD